MAESGRFNIAGKTAIEAAYYANLWEAAMWLSYRNESLYEQNRAHEEEVKKLKRKRK